MTYRPHKRPAAGPAGKGRRSRWVAADVPPPGGDQGVVGPWLLSYVDIISLLVALFVVLLSLSQFDKPAYRSMIDSLQGAARSAPTVTRPQKATPFPPPFRAEPESDGRDALISSLRDSVAGAGMSEDVDIRQREGGVEISIRESVLFPSGVADLVADGETLLAALAPVFATGDYALSVEGHTDAVPIASDRFPSNWELSSARASSVVRFLIGKDIDPTRLTVVGHGETQPIASNDTAEGRARNRRVNFILQVPGK